MTGSARRRGLVAGTAVLALIAIAWPTLADADAGTDTDTDGDTNTDAAVRFDHAAELIAGENFAAAATLLLGIAEQQPRGELADDALFAAAQLHEEKLGDPLRALTLYDRILADYPDSRAALAASRRARLLRDELGPDGSGAGPLAAFTAIQHSFTESGAAASVKRVEELLDKYPSWSGRPRALLWLADLHGKEGNSDAAIDRYVEAATAAPGSSVAFAGYRGAGGVALAADRFDDAERYFRLMPINGDPSRQRDFEHALLLLDHARLRARFYQLAFIILFVIAGALGLALWRSTGSARAGLARLTRPPTECIYMAPIATLFILAGYGHPDSIGPAVALICVVSFAFIWLSGAGLDAAGAAHQRMGRRVAAHIFATLLAVTAICYIAVHRTRLIDQILTTVRFGPDA